MAPSKKLFAVAALFISLASRSFALDPLAANLEAAAQRIQTASDQVSEMRRGMSEDENTTIFEVANAPNAFHAFLIELADLQQIQSVMESGQDQAIVRGYILTRRPTAEKLGQSALTFVRGLLSRIHNPENHADAEELINALQSGIEIAGQRDPTPSRYVPPKR